MGSIGLRGWTVAIAAGAWLGGCAETGDRYFKPIPEADYPPATGPGEFAKPEERDEAARIAAIIEAHLRRLYPAGSIHRDAHPKAHGCVAAILRVLPNPPNGLGVGLFAEPRTYKALVRFSNSNEDPAYPDFKGDGRGMAIKVFDPFGTPLTRGPDGQSTQDFIMISHPTFIIADGAAYRRLIGYVDADDWLTQKLQPLLAATALGWTGTRNMIATTSLRIDNPLNTRYWSMVPYQIGTGAAARAVKYSAMPCEATPAVVPETTDPNYLRAAMAASLAKGGACMRLMVQLRTDPDTQSVEDPRTEWMEDKAPFYPVAEIAIPAQTFDTPAQNAACEKETYSPWHALSEHRPLGGVNRMRKAIYERIETLRLTPRL